MAVTVAASGFFFHEAGGHALVGRFAGIRDLTIYATHTDWRGKGEVTVGMIRAFDVAGTGANLATFAIATLLFRYRAPRALTARAFLFCLGSVHGYLAFGYMMTSNPMRTSDWWNFSQTFTTSVGFWAAAAIVTAIGVAGYFLILPRLFRRWLALLCHENLAKSSTA